MRIIFTVTPTLTFKVKVRKLRRLDRKILNSDRTAIWQRFIIFLCIPFVCLLFKDIINLYFTKFAVICLSPSISPSNQHINGCFILTENWYALPMVFFLLLGTQNKMSRYHILKYLGPKACQSTCSYLFWSRNI